MKLQQRINGALVDLSCREISYSGIEHLQQRPTIYLSNHTDIVREPAIINYALAKEGLPIAHVGMGENLFRYPLLRPLLALQPNFRVSREKGEGRDIAKNINALLEEGKSIWIAQSNGRSRTGDFRTEQTLIAGFARAAEINIQKYCEKVAIVPVAVSAAYDPAAQIVAQLAAGQSLPWWSDIESIIYGTFWHKGDVHVAFNKPLTGVGKPGEVRNTADKAIHHSYRCFATHEQAYNERNRIPIEEWFTAPVETEMLKNKRLRAQIQRAPRELQPRIAALYAYPYKNSLERIASR